MATTKRIIQAPTLNTSWQVTGSSGKTYVTTNTYNPAIATSSSWWPTDNGGSYVDYNATTDASGNVIWWTSGRVNYDNMWKVVNTSVKPAVPTWWADKSVALMSAWKSWVTNNLAWGKTDNLPWVTKYAGNNQTYWNNQAGIDLVNRQTSNEILSEWEKAQRLAGAYNPVPTVATTQNPVVKRTLPKEETPVKPDIQAMDLWTIQENIDRLTYKVNSGKSLTEDEYVTFNQLRRQATDMMKPQSLTGGLDNLMTTQQNDITTTQKTLDEQNARDMEAFTRSQEAFKQSQFAELDRADEEKKKTLGYILGAQWSWAGSYTVEALNKITENTVMQKQAYQDSIQAKLDLYESQQRKDSAETIQKMKDRLYSTQLKAAEFDVANLQEINKYNQEQSKSTLEKLDNLKAMSDSILASSTPLTEEQKQQASVIWQFLVDPDWWLNQALLESYKKTNPNLIPYALSMAVGERNKIQQNKLAMQWLDADIKKAQLNKLLNPAKEYEYVKDADWNTIAVAKDNPNERINITWGGEWLWDLRGLASQFPWQARAKNNNPAGITRNWNFDNPKPWTTAYALQQAGIQYNKGTPRPWNEWGNYVTFNTIEDWLAAQRLMMSQTYGNSTVGKMLSSRVWTGEWPNYAKQVAWMAGLDVNTPISQLSDEQLSTLQMAKIKKESPWLAKLLQQKQESQPIEWNFPLYANYIESGKLPTGIKDWTSKAEAFKKQALEWYIWGKEQELNWLWLTIANPQAFASTASNAPKMKAINEALAVVPSFVNTMDQLISLTDKYGSELIPWNAKNQMSMLVKDAQLQAKEIYNLWVLNWPDLSLMESIIANPTDWTAKGQQLFGVSFKKSLENAKKKIMDNAIEKAKSIWLSPINSSNQTATTNVDSLLSDLWY